MNSYEKLLRQMCDSLIKHQISGYGSPHDGGFLCDACTVIHGRADNAIFPMLYVWSKTNDEKYFNCVRALLGFQKRLMCSDGSVYNDGQTKWKGTTAFSAIFFYKSLHHFGDIMPADIKEEMTCRLEKMSRWVFENIRAGFRSNINYYAAASAVCAMAGKYFGKPEYTVQSRELLSYCMAHMSENGIVAGEGQPHSSVTKRGCIPADMGYNLEETIPCLIDAATVLNDNDILNELAARTKKLLDFILPDGGIDNSFGSRNNKWTYYGSRTCDGSAAAFAALSRFDSIFSEAALRTAEMLKKSFRNGVLYGGCEYDRLNQPACIHHLFSHAAGLADALCCGLSGATIKYVLPCDRTDTGYTYYPEIDTYKIRTEKFLATVTGYDFRTYTYTNGASHSSGGTLSLLYSREKGPVIAGSVLEYSLTEPLNMQLPKGDIRHSSLIPRLEYVKDSVLYATCIDPESVIKVEKSEDAVNAYVKAKFVRISDWKTEDEELFAELKYSFRSSIVEIELSVSKEKDGIRFVLPIIENTAGIVTDSRYTRDKIFFLTGGFGADEYGFEVGKRTVKIELK